MQCFKIISRFQEFKGITQFFDTLKYAFAGVFFTEGTITIIDTLFFGPIRDWVDAQFEPHEYFGRLLWESNSTLFKNEWPDGKKPIPSRIAFGAIFIKEHENLVDVSTVQHIAENPYMQFFLGLKRFQTEPLFDASMLTHFRKRFSAEDVKRINEELYSIQDYA